MERNYDQSPWPVRDDGQELFETFEDDAERFDREYVEAERRYHEADLRGDTDDTPLVAGGQGRSGASQVSSAAVVCMCIGLAALIGFLCWCVR